MDWHAVFGRLQRILMEQFGKPEALLTVDATLTGALMLDPLDLADLSALVDHEFGVCADLQRPGAARSLGEVAQAVCSHDEPAE